ncbi:MAG: ApaG domain [Oceanipulchritudo sp.]
MKDSSPTTHPTPAGVFVTLDKLTYAYHLIRDMPERPHMFTYHLTIHNQSSRTIAILARKWVLRYGDGEVDVIEGDKVIGKTPELAPGKTFSYASFHLVARNALVEGAFHGVDDEGNQIHVPIPPFQLEIPGKTACD